MKTLLNHPYVFVVLELKQTGGCKVHGIYANRDEAEGKKFTLELKNRETKYSEDNYICILKKPIEGKKPEIRQVGKSGLLFK